MAANSLPWRQTRCFWKINRFNTCAQLAGEPICSPDFSLDSIGVTKFCLYVYPRGYSKINDFVSIYLVGYESNDEPSAGSDMRVELSLFFHDDKVNPIHSASVCSKVGTNIFLEISCIERRKIFLKYDKIFTYVNVMLVLDFIPVITKVNPKQTWICKAADLEKLSCDLSKALEISKYHDLILRGDGDFNFNAHKSILISRYPKLADTLGLHENTINECYLSMEPSALRDLLIYIYSGKIEIQNVARSIHNILHSNELPHLQHLLYPVPKTITASTTIRVRESYFIWNIPNFDELQGNTTRSTFLSCDNKIQWTKLQISCCLHKNEKNEDFIVFSIHRIFTEESIYITCRVRVLGTDYVKEYEHLFAKETESILLPFMSKEFLMDNKNFYLKSGHLKMSFEIIVSDGNFMSEITSVDYPDIWEKHCVPVAKNLISLQSDLKNLHENPIFSDITLNVGKEQFHAHRIILSLRSPVFSEMFENKTLENESELTIKDFEPDVVKSLLSYMYCGEVDEVPEDINFVSNLYAVADKYELPELKGKCAFHFKRELNSENAGKILVFAYSHSDDYLKDCVKKFISSHAKEILNSDEWKKVMNERMDIANDILSDVLSYIGRKKSRVIHSEKCFNSFTACVAPRRLLS